MSKINKDTNTQDYEQDEYEIIPEWVDDTLLDKIDDGIIISSMLGGYIFSKERAIIDLEEHR